MKAMISSTMLDLPEHRDAVRDACSRLDIQPVMTDFQGADAGTFLERSIALVDAADIYILVLGFRYGTIPQEQDESYTHLELDRARERGIPILAFLMADDHPVAPKYVDSGESRSKIDQLRREVTKRHGANSFRSTDHLRTEVITALSNMRLRLQPVGPPMASGSMALRPLPFVAHPYTLLGKGEVVGREQDIAGIADWFHDVNSGPILVVHGLGGAGKSACIWSWFSEHLPVEKEVESRLWWSFYEDNAKFGSFLPSLLAYLSCQPLDAVGRLSQSQQVEEAISQLSHGRHVLVLDGLERALRLYAGEDEAFVSDKELDAETDNLLALGGGTGQDPLSRERSQLRRLADPLFAGFLRRLARIPDLRIVISSRLMPADVQDRSGHPDPGVSLLQLSRLDDDSAMAIWESVTGDRTQAEQLAPVFSSVDNHPLFVRTLATEVRDFRKAPGDFVQWRQAHSGFDPAGADLVQAKTHILSYAFRGLSTSDSRVLLEIATNSGSVHYSKLERCLLAERSVVATASELDSALVSLEERALVGWDRESNKYEMHPVVRAVARRVLGAAIPDWQAVAGSQQDGHGRRTPDGGMERGEETAPALVASFAGEESLLPTENLVGAGVFEVHVVHGPDAGQAATLPLGRSQVGRSPSAWLTLTDPSMGLIAMVIEHSADGRVQVTVDNGNSIPGPTGSLGETFGWEAETGLEIGGTALALKRALVRVPVSECYPSGVVRRTPRLGGSARLQPPDAAETVLTARFGGQRLWERAFDDADFLSIVIGRTPSADSRPREPLSVSLKLERLLAVVGDSGRSSCANWLLAQLATYHSPADLEIALLAESEDSDVAWLAALPHVQSNHSSRVIGAAFGPRNCRRLAGQLASSWSDAPEVGTEKHRVVVVNDWHALSTIPGMHALVETVRQNSSLSMVILGRTVAGLPMATRVALEIGEHSNALLTRDGKVEFVPTGVSPSLAKGVADSLGGLRDFEVPRESDEILDAAPATLGQLLGVEPSPETVLARWSERQSQRALVGTSLDGPLGLDFSLDGPLILVGGTTGSGKSEFLKTLVTSVALAAPPTDVNVLLVDYKGGSAFGSLYLLPHVVGLVTDLSPHLVRRALISLSAEMKRREQLLNQHDVRDFGTYATYASRADTDVPALPHLVVVVDEFASLVVETPEFVDGLVGLAQRGRSLGITLVLATQRPAGIISAPLEAITHTRIALRCADAEDSVTVLGSPEAAKISPATPGRAIVRYRNGEMLSTQFAKVAGQLLRVDDAYFDTDKAVVEAIVAATEMAAMPEPRKAWLPELKATYDLADFSEIPNPRTDTELVFGVIDDPASQRQPAAVFHPDRDGNLAVYGTGGSGKSTLLRTLAVSAGLAVRSGPCQVYGLDFGVRGLAVLEELPHVGSILFAGDDERITRLLEWLNRLIDERAARYSRVDAATISDYRLLANSPDEVRFLLLVDGVDAFWQQSLASAYYYRRRWQDLLLRIASDGRACGVHVVLSSQRGIHTIGELAGSPDQLPFGGRTNTLSAVVPSRVVLRQSSADEYARLGLPADLLGPYDPPGRGFLGALQLQVATLGGSGNVVDQANAVRSLAESMCRAGVPSAESIARLPETICLEDLPESVDGDPVLGVSSETLQPIGFEPSGSFLITGPPGGGRTAALHTVALSLRRWRPNVELYLFCGARSALAELPIWTECSQAGDPSDFADRLRRGLSNRQPNAVPVVVLVENLRDVVNGPAEKAMQSLAKTLLDDGHFFVAECASDAAGGSLGLLAYAKQSRAGVALQPEQGDAVTFFRRDLRLERGVRYPPGRGLLVQQRESEIVQVALPT